MAKTGYIRYQKLQKYYLGKPVEPASYKKGELIKVGQWENLKDCENPIVISNLDCDVAVYDNVNNVINIVKGSDYNNQLYSEDRYKIIGIVVVPFEHDVYGDGSAGIMSLKLMSADNPDNGYWGLISRPCFGQKGVELNNFNTFPYVGGYQDGVGSAGDENSTIIGNYRVGYLPSGSFVDTEGIVCPHNTNVYYNGSRVIENTDHEIYYLLPSPYLTNGDRNPSYYQTESPSSANNALSDFDGLFNSKQLIELATAQSDWKTANRIFNDPSGSHSPAACCCWRYHTDGTKQGDWYLPSAGEIGYFINNYDKISNTLEILVPDFIKAIKDKDGVFLERNFLTSTSSAIKTIPSTDSINHECIGFDLYDCSIYAIRRNYYCSAIAFIRIKPDGTIIN